MREPQPGSKVPGDAQVPKVGHPFNSLVSYMYTLNRRLIYLQEIDVITVLGPVWKRTRNPCELLPFLGGEVEKRELARIVGHRDEIASVR